MDPPGEPPMDPPGEPRPGNACADVDADLVEYVVLGVPHTGSLHRVAHALVRLVEASAIRILDIVVLTKTDDGTLHTHEASDLPSLAPLTHTPGWYGGLLSSHDMALISTTLPPASTAVLLLAEDRWAQPLAHAARTAGGRLLGGERIPRSRIHASLTNHTHPASPPPQETPHATQHPTP